MSAETETDLVLAVLVGARKLLTPEGAWCQGASTNERGQRCLLRALHESTPLVHGFPAWTVWREAISALRAVAQTKWTLTHWNEVAGRTQGEVLALLDKTVAARRAEVRA